MDKAYLVLFDWKKQRIACYSIEKNSALRVN